MKTIKESKVGDKVMFIDDKVNMTKNKLYEILEINDRFIITKNDNGFKSTYFLDRFGLGHKPVIKVAPTNKTKFVVGQKVEVCNETNDITNNKIYEVKNIKGFGIFVENDKGEIVGYSHTRFIESIKLSETLKGDLTKFNKTELTNLFYIDDMARILNLEIENINLAKHFTDLNLDKGEIDKILSSGAFKEKDFSGQKIDVDDETAKEIAKYANRRFIEKKQQTKMRIESYKNDITYKLQEIESYKSKIVENNIELRNMTDNTSGKIIERMQNIQNNYWNFVEFEDGNMIFESRYDLVMNHKNEKARINTRVNLGTYKLKINSSNFAIRLQRNNDNVMVGSYFHPHVNSSGEFCWGNASDLIDEARNNFDVNQILKITEMLLPVYNPDSPYEPLGLFAGNSKQIQPNGELYEAAERQFWFYCSNCEYEYSENGDETLTELYVDCPECGLENYSETYDEL